MPLSPIEPLGSLDDLSRLAARERDRQTAHFEALDTKAGLLLAFAGILVGIAPDVVSLMPPQAQPQR